MAMPEVPSGDAGGLGDRPTAAAAIGAGASVPDGGGDRAMTRRQFRAAGEPPPAMPPKFPHIWPANSPPYKRGQQSAAIRAAIAAAEAREQKED